MKCGGILPKITSGNADKLLDKIEKKSRKLLLFNEYGQKLG
jgi:hypothetical protein